MVRLFSPHPFLKLKYNEIPRPPTAINMTGWLEAGAITERAWALVQCLDFSWERLPLCDAGGCRGIRGWEGPPRDRGCLARGRGSEMGVDGTRGAGCGSRRAVRGEREGR